jgi:hypothetical protein
MLLLGGVVTVPALVIGGAFVLGTGRSGDRASAEPVPTHRHTVRIPDLPERTWGRLIPHRRPRPTPTPAPTTAAVPHSTTRPHPTATGRSENGCPPSMKRWPWMWQLCKRRHGERPNPG